MQSKDMQEEDVLKTKEGRILARGIVGEEIGNYLGRNGGKRGGDKGGGLGTRAPPRGARASGQGRV